MDVFSILQTQYCYSLHFRLFNPFISPPPKRICQSIHSLKTHSNIIMRLPSSASLSVPILLQVRSSVVDISLDPLYYLGSKAIAIYGPPFIRQTAQLSPSLGLKYFQIWNWPEPTPAWIERTRPQNSVNTKPSPTQKRYVLCACAEQMTGCHCDVILSACL